MLGQIIGAFFVILIGFTLYPEITGQIKLAAMNSKNGTTESLQVVVNLFPFFFLGTVVLVVLFIIISAIRNAGLDGDYTEDYEDDQDEKKKQDPNHKQTYEEYVQERLRIEREMA